VSELLGAWGNFYVMIGSSAAALTGLVFVVISLASSGRRTASEEGIATFSTPTIMHFGTALFIAAVMAAPLRSLVAIAILLGLAGAWGIVCVVRVAIGTRRLATYQPDRDDWVWHVVMPLAAYALLLGGAAALAALPGDALYALAAAATLLIFIGIHNAWDVVTFLAMDTDEA
jgi:hypothetical protein